MLFYFLINVRDSEFIILIRTVTAHKIRVATEIDRLQEAKKIGMFFHAEVSCSK